MARRRKSLGALRFTFRELPDGACFAFDPTAKHATRRKVDERHTIVIPGGKRPLVVDNAGMHVHLMTCPTSFGRRRSKSKRRR